MSATTAAIIALALYLAGLAAAFGVRSWIQHWTTGSTGFRGPTGTPGSSEWWGGVLFAAALLAGVAGPVLALAGAVPAWPLHQGFRWVGLVLTLAGILATLGAQADMGASWRIGVDPRERTALVTTGPFALVRNPIFTAMLMTLTGMALMVFTPIALAALLMLLAAVEIQVRRVEEPHLRRTHGTTYTHYASRVGRFLPGLGASAPPFGTAPLHRPDPPRRSRPRQGVSGPDRRGRAAPASCRRPTTRSCCRSSFATQSVHTGSLPRRRPHRSGNQPPHQA